MVAELLCGEVGNEHILRSTVCLSNKTFVEALPYAKQHAYTFRWFKALTLALIDIFGPPPQLSLQDRKDRLAQGQSYN